jgi:DNA repair protein RadC
MNARTTPAVLRLARRILDHCGGLQGLAAATGHQLRQIPGVDRARSARIRAAFEMTQRAHEKSLDFGDGIHHPTEAVRVILSRHAKTGKEVFGILLLDVKNRPRGYKIVSVGTLDQSLVHPREVFREAIADGASKVILFHNHPSGDSRPSAEDVDITRRLVNVGETVGIPVLDHLILGSGGTYTSLKDMGVI